MEGYERGEKKRRTDEDRSYRRLNRHLRARRRCVDANRHQGSHENDDDGAETVRVRPGGRAGAEVPKDCGGEGGPGSASEEGKEETRRTHSVD